MPQGTQHAAAAFFPTRFGRNTCAPLLSLCWFQSSGPSLLRCAALAPLGRNVLLGVLCLLVLQKFIGSQGLGILEAWYFEGTMGDGVHFHVGVFLGALDPPKWDEAFLLFGIISPSGILLPWIGSWPAWSWMLKFLPGQPQTHGKQCWESWETYIDIDYTWNATRLRCNAKWHKHRQGTEFLQEINEWKCITSSIVGDKIAKVCQKLWLHSGAGLDFALGFLKWHPMLEQIG